MELENTDLELNSLLDPTKARAERRRDYAAGFMLSFLAMSTTALLLWTTAA